MSATLHERADAVWDEATFVAFIAALAEDWEDEGPGANEWENGTIAAFLGAAAAWGESTKNGTEFYSVPSNPWRRAAQILLAGKFYE